MRREKEGGLWALTNEGEILLLDERVEGARRQYHNVVLGLVRCCGDNGSDEQQHTIRHNISPREPGPPADDVFDASSAVN